MNERLHSLSGDIHRQMDLVLRYWKLISILLVIGITLYTTVLDVKAHSKWILRADQILFATFVNSMLACVRSGEKECVTLEKLEGGHMQLELPTMQQAKE